jgi:hypothetical protein
MPIEFFAGIMRGGVAILIFFASSKGREIAPLTNKGLRMDFHTTGARKSIVTPRQKPHTCCFLTRDFPLAASPKRHSKPEPVERLKLVKSGISLYDRIYV